MLIENLGSGGIALIIAVDVGGILIRLEIVVRMHSFFHMDNVYELRYN